MAKIKFEGDETNQIDVGKDNDQLKQRLDSYKDLLDNEIFGLKVQSLVAEVIVKLVEKDEEVRQNALISEDENFKETIEGAKWHELLAFDTKLTNQNESFLPILEKYLLAKGLDATILAFAFYEDQSLGGLLRLHQDNIEERTRMRKALKEVSSAFDGELELQIKSKNLDEKIAKYQKDQSYMPVEDVSRLPFFGTFL